MSQPATERLSAHGVAATGATVLEVRRGGMKGVRVGHVRRLTGRRCWEWQPEGWQSWSGDARLLRDAVAALGASTDSGRS